MAPGSLLCEEYLLSELPKVLGAPEREGGALLPYRHPLERTHMIGGKVMQFSASGGSHEALSSRLSPWDTGFGTAKNHSHLNLWA